MKIAICYKGLLRTVDEVFENNKKFFSVDDHDVDFFVHSWKTDSHQDEQIQFVRDVVKPKRLLIEDTKKFGHNVFNSMIFEDCAVPTVDNKDKFNQGYGWTCKPYQLMSFFYSFFMSNSLLKEYSYTNNVEYDYVINMRSDLKFGAPLDYSRIDTDLINATNWDVNVNFNQFHNMDIYTDMISISSQENINKCADCFLYLDKYYFSDKCLFFPESVFAHHLKQNNLKGNYMQDVSHSVVRRPDYGHLKETGRGADV